MHNSVLGTWKPWDVLFRGSHANVCTVMVYHLGEWLDMLMCISGMLTCQIWIFAYDP